MKPTTSATLAAALLLSATAFAQTSGVSRPEDLQDTITTETPTTVSATPVTVAITPRPTPAPIFVASSTPPQTPQTTQTTQPHLTLRPIPVDPADAGIVTTFPYTPNALGEGTLLKARLVESISTKTTTTGTRFTATLSNNIEHAGVVIFPAGSTLEGRITELRGGHRIGGTASIHLQPERLTLPDGSQFHVSARVIDLDQFRNAHVNAEGTILRSDHAKGTLAALTLTAGSGAAAGAALAGVPGALVGAGIGAGVGTVVWLRQDRQQTLAAGSEIIFSLTRPLDLTPIAR